MNFDRYVNEVFGTLEKAEQLCEENLDAFESKQLDLYKLIRKDMLKRRTSDH